MNYQNALAAAWRSGHRIRLTNKNPGSNTARVLGL
jgi:hypothetical protein